MIPLTFLQIWVCLVTKNCSFVLNTHPGVLNNRKFNLCYRTHPGVTSHKKSRFLLHKTAGCPQYCALLLGPIILKLGIYIWLSPGSSLETFQISTPTPSALPGPKTSFLTGFYGFFRNMQMEVDFLTQPLDGFWSELSYFLYFDRG